MVNDGTITTLNWIGARKRNTNSFTEYNHSAFIQTHRAACIQYYITKAVYESWCVRVSCPLFVWRLWPRMLDSSFRHSSLKNRDIHSTAMTVAQAHINWLPGKAVFPRLSVVLRLQHFICWFLFFCSHSFARGVFHCPHSTSSSLIWFLYVFCFFVVARFVLFAIRQLSVVARDSCSSQVNRWPIVWETVLSHLISTGHEQQMLIFVVANRTHSRYVCWLLTIWPHNCI